MFEFSFLLQASQNLWGCDTPRPWNAVPAAAVVGEVCVRGGLAVGVTACSSSVDGSS